MQTQTSSEKDAQDELRPTESASSSKTEKDPPKDRFIEGILRVIRKKASLIKEQGKQ